MPQNVRNFWLTGRIDGRSTAIEGGPQAKTGGFRLTVKQRSDGGIVDGAYLDGRADDDGNLTLTIAAGTRARVELDGDRIVIRTHR